MPTRPQPETARFQRENQGTSSTPDLSLKLFSRSCKSVSDSFVLFRRVTVQSAQQKINSDVSEDHRRKTDHRDPRRAFAAPAAHEAAVQENRVDEPRDERPGFLRVPRPVGAPRGIRPDRAGENADGEKQKS